MTSYGQRLMESNGHPSYSTRQQLYDKEFRWVDPKTVKFCWYDPMTYPQLMRYITVGYGAHFLCIMATRAVKKQPMWAGLAPHLIYAMPQTALFVFAMKYRYRQFQAREEIINHYVSLHPEDFEHLMPANQRKYRDVLRPWIPIRTSFAPRWRPQDQLPYTRVMELIKIDEGRETD